MAAGYATRLYPLTRDRAKPLLPIAGRPMIDYIADGISSVTDIDRIYCVTNSRFFPSFAEWAAGRRGTTPVEVIDDGTSSDEDKLGAIGDIRFVIKEKGLDDDLFIVAGDNLFDLELERIISFFRENGPTVGVYDIGDWEAARRYGIVTLEGSGRIADFQEKPSRPRSTLAAIGLYVYPRRAIPLFDLYAEGGNSMDAPGNFVRWLAAREPVYGYLFTGVWYDIGDLEMYRRADALYSSKRKRT